jgi:putative redox protein
MNAHVKWHKGLTFTGTADTGFTVPLGARLDTGGENDGFRPMELLATGLAGCTAMDVISILTKKQQEVIDFEVAVHTERAKQHPRVFTHITIEYHVTGHEIDEKAVVRAIDLSAKRYCPAQSMFVQIVPIDLQYMIYEADGNHRGKIIASGELKSGELV